LVGELDRNSDGVIQLDEFVEAFEPRLCMIMEDFYDTVAEFAQVAAILRQGGAGGGKGSGRESYMDVNPTNSAAAGGSFGDSQARYGDYDGYEPVEESPGLDSCYSRSAAGDKQGALQEERRRGGGRATEATHNWADSTSTTLLGPDGSPIGKRGRRADRHAVLSQLPPHVRAELERDETARNRHVIAGRDPDSFVSPSAMQAATHRSPNGSPKARKKSPQELSPDTQEALMRYAEPFAHAAYRAT